MEAASTATDQGKDKLGDAQEQAKEKLGQAQEQARGRAQQEIDTRSTQAGEQARSMADALRSTSEKLREEGKDGPGQMADRAAEQVDKVGGYLVDSDSDRILRDAEDFARRQPWVVLAGGVALGFAAARFLTASSAERARGGQLAEGSPDVGNGAASGRTVGSPSITAPAPTEPPAVPVPGVPPAAGPSPAGL